jgi:hypothetical protein
VKQSYPVHPEPESVIPGTNFTLGIPLIPKTGIGWLTFQIDTSIQQTRRDVWALLHLHFGLEWEASGLTRSGIELMTSVGRVPGVRLRRKGDDWYELILSQSVIELILPDSLRQFCLDLRAVLGHLAHCTRADFYRDTVNFTVQDVRDCVHLGFLVSPSRCCSDRNKWVPPSFPGDKPIEYLGDTLYVGSRDSGRFTRVYDKGLEQGEAPGLLTRVESEVKRRNALTAFNLLCETDVNAWNKLISDVIVSCIDFRQIENAYDREHCTRMPRQQWWADFLEDDSCRVSLWTPMPKKSLDDSFIHFCHQWAVMVYAMSQSFPEWESMVEALYADGKRRLKARHRILMTT